MRWPSNMFEKVFTDPSFDFETRTLLGGTLYGAGDIGEMPPMCSWTGLSTQTRS
jgi:hypothetical protein